MLGFDRGHNNITGTTIVSEGTFGVPFIMPDLLCYDMGKEIAKTPTLCSHKNIAYDFPIVPLKKLVRNDSVFHRADMLSKWIIITNGTDKVNYHVKDCNMCLLPQSFWVKIPMKFDSTTAVVRTTKLTWLILIEKDLRRNSLSEKKLFGV